jgi:hypothetical protein
MYLVSAWWRRRMSAGMERSGFTALSGTTSTDAVFIRLTSSATFVSLRSLRKVAYCGFPASICTTSMAARDAGVAAARRRSGRMILKAIAANGRRKRASEWGDFCVDGRDAWLVI